MNQVNSVVYQSALAVKIIGPRGVTSLNGDYQFTQTAAAKAKHSSR